MCIAMDLLIMSYYYSCEFLVCHCIFIAMLVHYIVLCVGGSKGQISRCYMESYE